VVAHYLQTALRTASSHPLVDSVKIGNGKEGAAMPVVASAVV
jgi:hypothetical protein